MKTIALVKPFNHIMITEIVSGLAHRTTIQCGDFTSAKKHGVEQKAKALWSKEIIARFNKNLTKQNNLPTGLPAHKELAAIQIKNFATDARASLSNQADQYQLASWNDKTQRAQRVVAETASDTDLAILQTECDKRSKKETPQQLAAKQIAKSQALAKAIAVIDGITSVALDAVKTKRSANTLNKLVEQTQKQIDAALQLEA